MDEQKFTEGVRELFNMLGNNREVIMKLADHVVQEFPGKIVAIQSAIQQGDAEQVQGMAHAIKSAIANFGAEEASMLAYELEMTAKNNRLADVPEILERLDQEFARIYGFFGDPGWIDKL